MFGLMDCSIVTVSDSLGYHILMLRFIVILYTCVSIINDNFAA